jgi:TonB family protein
MAAALAALMCLRGPAAAEGRAGVSTDDAWGDRLFDYGENSGALSTRTEGAESFDSGSGWACSMSADEGIASLRYFDNAGGRALGLKVEFFRRSPSCVILSPPRPIFVDANCVMLSLRAFGSAYRHALSIIVLDYFGRSLSLPLGRLDFEGWKKMSVDVPSYDPARRSGIVQDDRHYSRPAGLRIAGLKIDFDPEEARGPFFAYFDDIEATIEGYGAVPERERPSVESPPEAGNAAEEGGGATALPAQTPAAIAKEADPAEESSRILSELSARIRDGLAYPAAARRRGLEGSVGIAFSVDARGALVGARVAESSGSDILDEAGIALLRSVFPIENDSGKELELGIAINYRLSEQR